MDQLIWLQPQVATAMRHAHEAQLEKSQLRQFDNQYDDLVAAVNGFLNSVAYGVSINTLHVTEWTSRADEIIADVKSFNTTIRAVQTSRRQAAEDRQSKGDPTSTVGIVPGKGLSVQIQLLDLTKLLEVRQQLRFDGLKVGEGLRAVQATAIRGNKWPERCAIGLADVRPCAPASPSP